ncbi:MAG: AsmA family protein, partial [Candidatus Zixiibacteriota bacterium]
MKKLLKIVGWIVVILVVLLVLAAVGVKLFFPVEKAKAMAIERGSEALGRPISVGDVSVSIRGGLGLVLQDVAVSSPPEMAAADLLTAQSIDLKLKILPLLGGKYRVDRLIIDNPTIHLLRQVDGSNNYTFPIAEQTKTGGPADQLPPETKTAVAAVSFEKFHINGGRLEYVDDSSHSRLYASGLDLETRLSNPRTGVFESSGKLSADTVMVQTDEPFRPVSCRLRYHAEYNVAEGRLSLQDTELKANELTLLLSGRLVQTDTTFVAHADVQTKSVSVGNLISLLPPGRREQLKGYSVSGDFTLDANIEYDGNRPDPLDYSGTAVLSDIRMSAEKLPADLQFRQVLVDFEQDNVRFNIEEGAFDGQPLKGHLVVEDFSDPLINGALSGGCDLAYVTPFIPSLEAIEATGKAQFDVKLRGRIRRPEEIGFSGSLLIDDGSLKSNLLPVPIESFSCDLFFDNKVTRINRASAGVAAGHVNLSGRVENLVTLLLADSTETRRLSLPVYGHIDGRLDLSALSTLLPPAGNPGLGGTVEFDLNLNGNAAEVATLQPQGRLTLTKVVYTDDRLPEPIRKFEASLHLLPDTLTIERMSVEFESSDLAISGKLVRPLPYLLPLESIDRSGLKKPYLSFELESRRFDTDRLFPEAVPGSETNRSALAPDSLPPLLLPDIDGQGTVRFDTVIYSRVEFTSLAGKARIHDRKLTLHDVTGKVYTGDIAGQTTIDLKDFNNPLYTGEFQATQVEANDFITRFTKFGGHLFGKANLNGSYSARGWEPGEFQRTLTMDGHLDVREGMLKTSGTLYTTISSIARMFNRTVEP